MYQSFIELVGVDTGEPLGFLVMSFIFIWLCFNFIQLLYTILKGR